MAHSHSHTSSHLPEDNNARRLLYAFGVTAGFMLVEVVGGFLSGSLALLVDAGHMLTDTAALLFRPTRRAIFTSSSHHSPHFRLAKTDHARGVCECHSPRGNYHFDCLGGDRTLPHAASGRGRHDDGNCRGWVAGKYTFFLVTSSRQRRENLNVRAAALHVLGDLLGSVGAIIAALIIIWTGWTPADPILSILVSLLVLRSAWRLLKDSVNELLEGAPVSLDIAELKRRMCREIPEVRNVHHVHVWMVGEKPVMTLHVQVIPPHDHDALLDQINTT